MLLPAVMASSVSLSRHGLLIEDVKRLSERLQSNCAFHNFHNMSNVARPRRDFTAGTVNTVLCNFNIFSSALFNFFVFLVICEINLRYARSQKIMLIEETLISQQLSCLYRLFHTFVHRGYVQIGHTI